MLKLVCQYIYDDLHICSRPLREEEILATRISQYPSPDAVLLDTPKISKKKSSGKATDDKISKKKKKEKKSKQNKEVDLILPELAKDADALVDAKSNGKKRSKSSKSAEEAPEGAKVTKTDKHKKSKKKTDDKDSKKKASKNSKFIITK